MAAASSGFQPLECQMARAKDYGSQPTQMAKMTNRRNKALWKMSRLLKVDL